MTTNAADGQAGETGTTNDGAQSPDAGQAQPSQTTGNSLEELLAGLDDTQRNAVLGQVREARQEAKNLRGRVKELEPKAQAHDAASQKALSAEERAAQAQQAAETRVVELQRKVVRSTVQAFAAGFQDPTDAERYLDNLDAYLEDDGTVDEATLRTDLADVLKARPWLAKTDGRRGPRPDPTQASGANGVPAGDPAAAFQSFITGQLAGR